MNTGDLVNEAAEVKWFDIQYPASAYTFPKEAWIHQIRFDEQYLHITLVDGRLLSIPLWWIPTLHNADRKDLEKYEIVPDRKMITWDLEKCTINDEVRIADYLGPVKHKQVGP